MYDVALFFVLFWLVALTIALFRHRHDWEEPRKRKLPEWVLRRMLDQNDEVK